MAGSILQDRIIETVDMHTCGEPLRIVTSGLPQLAGKTLLEKRAYCKHHMDELRRFLMFEPRGHADMYGCYVVEADDDEADFAVLFLHNEGYSTMCGHGVIALARYALDYKLVKTPVEPETRVNVQCPCGLVSAYVQYDAKTGKTGHTRFRSVPAFAVHCGVTIDVSGYGAGSKPGDASTVGRVKLDLAYGGAFYALVNVAEVMLDIRKSPIAELKQAAAAIKSAARSSLPVEHPFSPELSFLYGVIFTDGHANSWEEHEQPGANLTIFADGEVDRSPCGSGTTARLAAQYAKGQIPLGKQRVFVQPLVPGSSFLGSVVEEVEYGGRPAIIAEVQAKAHYSGKCQFQWEADDNIGKGFLIA